MTGINIQSPWSSLLINGDKCVETRNYPLPKKYEGEELALISTPGKYGNIPARIIGTITFTHSFKYPSKETWKEDCTRHLVAPNDEQFGWSDEKEKYGWVVSNVKRFDNPLPAPKNKGIIFTLDCKI